MAFTFVFVILGAADRRAPTRRAAVADVVYPIVFSGAGEPAPGLAPTPWPP